MQRVQTMTPLFSEKQKLQLNCVCRPMADTLFLCFRSVEGEESWLVVVNVYCPMADPEKEERIAFQRRFHQLLQIRAESLLNGGRYHVTSFLLFPLSLSLFLSFCLLSRSLSYFSIVRPVVVEHSSCQDRTLLTPQHNCGPRGLWIM